MRLLGLSLIALLLSIPSAAMADEQTQIQLNGFMLDGADAAATSQTLASIPAELRAPASAPVGDERRMLVVQFRGAPTDEWLDNLRATGAFIITYSASNGYIVVANLKAYNALQQLRSKPYMLAIWNYEPAFKLRPELRPPVLQRDKIYDVVVQVVADDEGSKFVDELSKNALKVLTPPNKVLNYINIDIKLDGAHIIKLARNSSVFAIEPKLEAQPLSPARHRSK